MYKILLFIFVLMSLNLNVLQAQNLVINPDAESMPLGTGWTAISAGALTCSAIPTSTYLNWTMIPDGTANYPFDHTTGSIGGTIFYSGCSSAFQGPFELQQDIDVSADATNIDAGNVPYIFSGYMQTPVSNQTDQGRFIVDYMDASNIKLGTSYTSAWQSYFGGSGAAWIFYTDTRIAPVGTRKIRIRLQSQMWFNVPAINVYFDDIALVKANILPVKLISFSGTTEVHEINLSWKVADELDLARYEIERSGNGVEFRKIAAIRSGNNAYYFTDKNISNDAGCYFYRLKMVDHNGKFSFSNTISIKNKAASILVLSPNPANNFVTVSGFKQKGNITIINTNGTALISMTGIAQTGKLNISSLPTGMYFMRCDDGGNISFKKLVVQNQ